MTNTTTVTTAAQITAPILGMTTAADGSKLNFTEIRRKHRVRLSQGLPLPQRHPPKKS